MTWKKNLKCVQKTITHDSLYSHDFTLAMCLVMSCNDKNLLWINYTIKNVIKKKNGALKNRLKRIKLMNHPVLFKKA